MTQGTKQFLRLSAVAGCCMVLLGSSARPTPASFALPGDLPKPLAQMTSGELWAAGNGLGYDNGPVQGRDCARGACMGRIDAVRNQTPGAANISPNGTIVARLMNLGSGGGGADEGAEARYGMQRDGARRYYLIALRTGDGWSWTVREATPNGSTPPIETASGTWVACRHNPDTPGHPKGRSEFASCGSAGGDDDEMRMSGPSLPLVSQSALRSFPPRDPGWLTCTDGCCTAGM